MFNFLYYLLILSLLLYGGYETTVPIPPDQAGQSGAPKDAPLPTPTVIEAALDQPFELRLGDMAVLTAEGLRVQFTAVHSDSRCPLDVLCDWWGVVGLEFAAQGPDGSQQTATLGGYAGQDGEVRPAMETGTAPHMWLDGYTIEIKRVVPYPAHQDQRLAPEEYVATLVVTRAEVD